MKKAFFFVGLSLLLPLVLLRPADAAREVTAKNETPYYGRIKLSNTKIAFFIRSSFKRCAPGSDDPL
jgi:hypothetical protein